MKIAYFVLAGVLTLGAGSAALAQYQGNDMGGGNMGGPSMGGMGEMGDGSDRPGSMGRFGNGRLAACSEDLRKLCPNATGRERQECLADNEDKISPACKTELSAPPPPNSMGGGRGGDDN